MPFGCPDGVTHVKERSGAYEKLGIRNKDFFLESTAGRWYLKIWLRSHRKIIQRTGR